MTAQKARLAQEKQFLQFLTERVQQVAEDAVDTEAAVVEGERRSSLIHQMTGERLDILIAY